MVYISWSSDDESSAKFWPDTTSLDHLSLFLKICQMFLELNISN